MNSLTERQRMYNDDLNNTASPVWLFGLGSGILLLLWMITEYSVKKVQLWTTKVWLRYFGCGCVWCGVVAAWLGFGFGFECLM